MTAPSGARTTVALVFGGRSNEHGISCVTAAGFLEAIDRNRFDVVPVGITADGDWVLASDDPEQWRIRDGRAPQVPADAPRLLVPSAVPAPGRGAPLLAIDPDGATRTVADIDVFLPLLHGPYGEDGTIQGLFDLFDIPYVGSGVFASAAGQDKHFTKAVLRDAGIAVTPSVTVRRHEWRADPAAVRTAAAALTMPVFVKPTRAGSSLGVSRITDLDQLGAALEDAFVTDPKVLIEQGVDGREIEVAVLGSIGGQDVRTALPGEIRAGGVDFYTYESKYFGAGDVHVDVPADLTPDESARAQTLAAHVFSLLDLEGLGRVDLFLTRDGDLLVNEVNTMPGCTPFSLFPVAWDRMGLRFPELITTLIDLALRRPAGLR